VRGLGKSQWPRKDRWSKTGGDPGDKTKAGASLTGVGSIKSGVFGPGPLAGVARGVEKDISREVLTVEKTGKGQGEKGGSPDRLGPLWVPFFGTRGVDETYCSLRR